MRERGSKDVPLELRFFLRSGRAVPLGVGSEPATHARPSLPDWANSVGMRGSVCLPWNPGTRLVFPRQVRPKGERLVMVAKPGERLQGESRSQQRWAGQDPADASSGCMRGQFIWCYS